MKYISILIAGGLLLAPFQLLASDSEKFEAKDIFDLEYATEPQVSPDGKSVLFVRRSNDIMLNRTKSNIWIARADGADQRPLLSGQKNFSMPRWSPDGSRVAYISNLEGTPQLYVRWIDSGDTALLTNIQKSAGNISWSPDGKTIAFTMSVEDKVAPLKVEMPKMPKGAKWSPKVKYVSKARYQADGRGILEPAYTHIFVVPSLGGTARQLSSGNYHHRGALSWSNDSSEILFSANRSENWEYESRESNIYGLTLRGKIRQLTKETGSEATPKISPDGRYIAYVKSDNKKLAYRTRSLYIMKADGTGARILTPDLDRSVSNIIWNQKSSGLYYQFNNHGVTNVGYSDLKGRQQVVAKGLGGTTLGRPYSSGTYHTAAGTIAYTAGRHDRPADLHTLVKNKARQITSLNEDLLGHKTLATLKEVTYKSSIDGEKMQGWYLLPPNFDASKKYPLILEIHGGPHLSYGPHFSAELQRFAAEGYIVFYDNHRGSTSYGERFALLLQNKYSSEYDFADHMSGVDAMIAKGFVDPERLFIAGGSAGGIASAYAIGLTDRFKAAAVAKPVINWLSKVLTADSGLGQISNQFPGMPWDHMEHYWKRSPLSLVGNVTTPTMLITGEDDKRTPISETEQFYQALKLLKVDVLMVRVPGSPHSIAGRPSRMIAKVENILAWFKKYDESK